MKTFLFVMLILLSENITAQKTPFIRIYDSLGKKIYRGKIYIVTDSSLFLIGKTEPLNIPIKSIAYIKTKHSAGNNILVGSIVGAASGAIIGLAAAGPQDNQPQDEIFVFSPGESAAGGAILGVAIGAAVGGLTAAHKKSETFLINGDVTKWKQFASVYEKK